MHNLNSQITIHFCLFWILQWYLVKSRIVTINNNLTRTDINGNILDSHSGVIVEVNNTYYLYGERYGNATGMVTTWKSQNAPRIGVYTSNDLTTWIDHGIMLNDSYNTTTGWLPYVFYDTNTNRFICWFGSGGWSVIVSDDGINFYYPPNIPQHQTSRLGGKVNGNNVFIDDDRNKTGYIIFSGLQNNTNINRSASHVVSIEILTPNYLESTKVNISDFFPDGFVECSMLFKRNNIYYVTYGSCCCACRVGSGFVVFKSKSIYGPWIRQINPSDVNCDDYDVNICRGYDYSPSIGNYIIPAQGYYLAKINTINTTEPTLMWMADRWVQAEGNNQKCTNLCQQNQTQQCSTESQPNYRVGHDPMYWAPLQFDEDGNILPFKWFDSFTLNIKD